MSYLDAVSETEDYEDIADVAELDYDPGDSLDEDLIWADAYLSPDICEDDLFPEEAVFRDGDEYEAEDLWDGEGVDERDRGALVEALRGALSEDLQDASSSDLEEALDNIFSNMSAAEGFSLGNALKTIGSAGKKVVQNRAFVSVAGTLAPVAGAAVGTMLGGPVGTAIGAKLGSVAGQALSGVPKPSTSGAAGMISPGGIPPTTIPHAPAFVKGRPSLKGGSVAATKLLQMTQNPVVLKGLLSLAMGEYGKKSIPSEAGGKSVSVGSIANMLSQFAGQVASDAEELAQGYDATPAYLYDEEGQSIADPAVPEARAAALYNALTESQNDLIITEDSLIRPWSDYFPFPAGTRLLVEYETWIRNWDIGRAQVRSRSSDELDIQLHVDKVSTLNVPETEARVTIKYNQEGHGNRATVEVNGQRFTDPDVRIESGVKSRTISMSISILGLKVEKVVLSKVDSGEARITFKAGDSKHVLVLTRK